MPAAPTAERGCWSPDAGSRATAAAVGAAHREQEPDHPGARSIVRAGAFDAEFASAEAGSGLTTRA